MRIPISISITLTTRRRCRSEVVKREERRSEVGDVFVFGLVGRKRRKVWRCAGNKRDNRKDREREIRGRYQRSEIRYQREERRKNYNDNNIICQHHANIGHVQDCIYDRREAPRTARRAMALIADKSKNSAVRIAQSYSYSQVSQSVHRSVHCYHYHDRTRYSYRTSKLGIDVEASPIRCCQTREQHHLSLEQ